MKNHRHSQSGQERFDHDGQQNIGRQTRRSALERVHRGLTGHGRRSLRVGPALRILVLGLVLVPVLVTIDAPSLVPGGLVVSMGEAAPVSPVAPVTTAAPPAQPVVPATVRFDNYAIKLSPSPERAEVIASAGFDVLTDADLGLDSLCFFLHDELNVASVFDATAGKLVFTQSKEPASLNYSLVTNKVCVRLSERLVKGDTLRLVVFYNGKFTESPLRSVSDFMRLTSDGLFLRGPGYAAWFPTVAATLRDIDAAASMQVEVFVSPPWKALCEGELSLSTMAGLSVFNWVTREKIPISSAVLIASDYDTVSAHVGRQKLSFWCFPSPPDSSASVKLFGAAKELLGFFVQNFGDNERTSFPPRFTMVEMPIYGDFYSGTIMGISKGRILETSSIHKRAELASLIASKMVRKFAVPAVDSTAPGAAFLLESVPSYAYVPAIEKVFGKPFVLESAASVLQRYVSGRKRAEAGEAGFPPEKPLVEISVSEIPRYKNVFLLDDRGALVLHMLRKLIGDENFNLAIKSYMASFAERPENAGEKDRGVAADTATPGAATRAGSLETANPGVLGVAVAGDSVSVVSAGRTPRRLARLEDFIQIAEAASGKRLDWFFGEWLYGNVLPDYRLADMKVTVSHDTTFVDVKVENNGTGLMPVPVTLFTDKGQRTSEVWLAAHESAQLRFISRSKPKRVEIDPQKWILQADVENDGLDIKPQEPGKK